MSRPESFAATLRDSIQACIDRGLADPRVSGLITVTGIKVSPDYREATVMVSVMPAEKQDLTLHGLKSATPHIRHQVGQLMKARAVPEIRFKVDLAPKKQAAVMEAIARIDEERQARAAAGGGRDATRSVAPPSAAGPPGDANNNAGSPAGRTPGAASSDPEGVT